MCIGTFSELGNKCYGRYNTSKVICQGTYDLTKTKCSGRETFIFKPWQFDYFDAVNPLIFFYGSNILFNAGDIYLEASAIGAYLATDNWAQVGRYLAKITSDLLIKNPVMESWSYQNSETIGFTMTGRKNISPYVEIPNYIPARSHSDSTTTRVVSEKLAHCLDRFHSQH